MFLLVLNVEEELEKREKADDNMMVLPKETVWGRTAVQGRS